VKEKRGGPCLFPLRWGSRKKCLPPNERLTKGRGVFPTTNEALEKKGVLSLLRRILTTRKEKRYHAKKRAWEIKIALRGKLVRARKKSVSSTYPVPEKNT